MTTRGVDGASVAGIPDCTQLTREGYEFGFPRMSFGHARDSACGEYLLRLHGAGMLARPYAYVRSWEGGASQARFAGDLAAQLGQPFTWADVEPAKAQLPDGSWPVPTDDPRRAAEVFSAWCERARSDGLAFGVYGGPWYLGLLASAGLPEWVYELPLWLSHYGVPAPRLPTGGGWERVDVWQRFPNVRKAGAAVDLNEARLTREQLDRLLGGERDTPAGQTDPSLTLAVAWSDAASGTDGSVERFVDRDEGPPV